MRVDGQGAGGCRRVQEGAGGLKDILLPYISNIIYSFLFMTSIT